VFWSTLTKKLSGDRSGVSSLSSPVPPAWDCCPSALWSAPPALYVAPVWTTAHGRSVRIVSQSLVARVVSTLLHTLHTLHTQHTLQDQRMGQDKIWNGKFFVRKKNSETKFRQKKSLNCFCLRKVFFRSAFIQGKPGDAFGAKKNREIVVPQNASEWLQLFEDSKSCGADLRR
jgi:hypothetical protein